MQHVTNPTRQPGGDAPHTLDLVITSEEFVLDIEHPKPPLCSKIHLPAA